MERVVYLLGAGFSAPLGLPVMSNFLLKAKDIFYQNPDEFASFKAVFDTIDSMSKCKNYFDSDLFNIEEILSILEMRESLRGSKQRKSFVDFISKVINYYTPEIPLPERLPSNWEAAMFGTSKWRFYGAFVASLFNLRFKGDISGPSVRLGFAPLESSTAYSVISLNYDLVIENAVSYLRKAYRQDRMISLHRYFEPGSDVDPRCVVPLAKLHGSADTKQIIAPTWNKGINRELEAVWNRAHELVESANHIRIIGYSLPNSDAYIKYLLKSAVTNSTHLKSIDVICRDPHGDVQKRYDEFIKFKYYNFRNADVLSYLAHFEHQTKNKNHQFQTCDFNAGEFAHAGFVEEPVTNK